MKKESKTKKKKIVYEESPWGDDDPIIGRVIENFFVRMDDLEKLRKEAKKAGLSPEAFATGIVSDYLHGHLTRS